VVLAMAGDADLRRARVEVRQSRQPDGTMQVARLAIPPMPAELLQVIEEMK